MEQNVDYLIVGQGLAGTLLGHFLEQANQHVAIVDNQHEGAASKVAAGIINPITGRRYVKSWLIEELFPFADQTYRSLEQQLDIQFYHAVAVLRALMNHQEQDDWEERRLLTSYQKYMIETSALENYKKHINLAYAYGEVRPAAQVEIHKLIEAYREKWCMEAKLLSEVFDFPLLISEKSLFQYKEIRAKRIIFCEGASAKANPFFNYLPFGKNKGEALIVRIPDVRFNKLLKQGIFIVPLSESDTYWIGAANEWNYQNDQVSEKGRQYLVERLKNILTVPFEIMAHKAALRPVMKDRRPILGEHTEHSGMYIFNGLGTKGASLAPYFANHFTEHLTKEMPLMSEVDIQRFER